jgi:hypothetical protein
VRVLRTSDGTAFKVSNEDAPHLERFKWHLVRGREGRGYVSRAVRKGRQVSRIYAARLIARASDGQRVAYRNGDPLDLRRSNLVVLGAVAA